MKTAEILPSMGAALPTAVANNCPNIIGTKRRTVGARDFPVACTPLRIRYWGRFFPNIAFRLPGTAVETSGLFLPARSRRHANAQRMWLRVTRGLEAAAVLKSAKSRGGPHDSGERQKDGGDKVAARGAPGRSAGSAPRDLGGFWGRPVTSRRHRNRGFVDACDDFQSFGEHLRDLYHLTPSLREEFWGARSHCASRGKLSAMHDGNLLQCI